MKNKKKFFPTVHVIEKTIVHHLVEWLATVLSILGVLVIALDYIAGYYIWIVANVLWIWFALKHRHYGLFVLAAAYLIINIFAVVIRLR